MYYFDHEKLNIHQWGNEGFSFDPGLSTNRIKTAKNLQLKEMAGGHHIHLEQPENISVTVII